jgi:myo-inositol 2-dehydrogenase/D-chiro-inositol 1-dehydrogenase
VRTHRSSSVKLGVIGCGRATETLHLPALEHLPNAEVVAVADIDPGRLQRVADRFRIQHRHTNFLSLLDDPAVEVVAVCVPPQFHVEVALAALDAGKHLLIEKPLALCLDDADRLIKRATQSTTKVTVGFNLRWHRLLREAREIIQRGTLGPIELVRTVLTSGIRHRQSIPEWRNRRLSGGGVLFELGVHHFDLWRFLLQSEVEEIFATARSGQSDDESANVTARMANGVLVTSMFSERTSDNGEVEIYGQAGRLHVSCYRFDGLEYFSPSNLPGDVRTRLRKIVHTLKELPQGVLRMRQGGDFIASYRAEWRHFIDCIQQGIPPECTLEDGRRALEVALAAVGSASLGQPVKVAAPTWFPHHD